MKHFLQGTVLYWLHTGIFYLNMDALAFKMFCLVFLIILVKCFILSINTFISDNYSSNNMNLKKWHDKKHFVMLC